MIRKKMKRKHTFSRACGDYLSPERKKVYRTTYSDCGVDRVQKKKKNSEREPHRSGCDSVVEVYVVYMYIFSVRYRQKCHGVYGGGRG